MLYFPPFRFDERAGVLSKAGHEVPLTHKAADLLACLVEQPGTLASHQDIMQRVWPDTHVQPENIKALVHELRGALGDHVHPPIFIKSEPGRGYVFVPGVARSLPPFLSETEPTYEMPLAGRATELATLEHHLNRAIERAEPHFVLIEGERGIGKTGLCEALAQRAYRRFGARITCGQGLEVWGPLEEGAVLIDAFDVLARQYPAAVGSVLAMRAPSWVSRIAGPSDVVESGERPLRELVAALDDIAAEVPLLLVLEDLQWADVATIEALRAIGRRRAARLFIVATYSRREDLPAVEVLERVGRELSSSAWSATIELTPLGHEHLFDCLDHRFGTRVAQTLVAPLYQAIGGNPALALMALDSLIRLGGLQPMPEGWIVDPSSDRLDVFFTASLLSAFRCQIDRLSPVDRRMLQAAASGAFQFTAVELARMVGARSPAALEQRLVTLSQRQVLIETVNANAERTSRTESTFRFRHSRIADLLLEQHRKAGLPLHIEQPHPVHTSRRRRGRNPTRARH